MRLDVADDGAGFDADDRERRRERGPRRPALLDDLAARAGGRLDVARRPGAGTRFVLEVPAA